MSADPAEAAPDIEYTEDGAPVVAPPSVVQGYNIPDFEGKSVDATGAKVTSVANLEIGDQVWRVDDFVKLEVEGRVVSVGHTVNERSGKLVRVHTVKAVDCRVIPWEE